MNQLKEAAQQALEAMEYHVEQTRPIYTTSKAISALREAIEEEEKKMPITFHFDIHQDGKLIPPEIVEAAIRISKFAKAENLIGKFSLFGVSVNE